MIETIRQNKRIQQVGKWVLLIFFVLAFFLFQPMQALSLPSVPSELLASTAEEAQDEWLYVDHISLIDSDTGLAVANATADMIPVMKKIYNRLISSKTLMFSGNATISFNSFLSTAEMNSIFVGSTLKTRQKMLMRIIQTVFTALRFDDPSFYFLDYQKCGISFSMRGADVSNISISPYTGYSTYLIDGMGSGAGKISPSAAQAQIETAASQILSAMPDYAYDYQIVSYLHDALVESNTYDYTLSRTFTHTMYGSLVENKSVCDGYSYALKYLLNQAGIPSVVISGDTLSGNQWMGHMWNYVKLGNLWYAVDSTWSDTGAARHEYLLVGQTMHNGISLFYSPTVRKEKNILFMENTFTVSSPALAAYSYTGYAADVTYAGGTFNQNFNHAPEGTVIILEVPSLPAGKKLVLKNANGTDVDFSYTFENMKISFDMPNKNLSLMLVLEDADNTPFAFLFGGVAIDSYSAGETVTFQTFADLDENHSYTGKLVQANSDGTFTEITLPNFTFDYDEDSDTVSISFTMPYSNVNFILQTTQHLGAQPNDPPPPPDPYNPYRTDFSGWFKENYVYFIAACGGILIIVVIIGVSKRKQLPKTIHKN